MAVPILLIGKSGAGKSTSLRSCVDDPNWGLIKVLEKPLPFKGKIAGMTTDNYETIKQVLAKSKAKSIVIDDAGYLITNYFMRNHSGGVGNQVFTMYNKLADSFWGLIQYVINEVPQNKVVYIVMHEDVDDYGNIKAKTIGKLLDEKVSVEGMFTIVLRAIHRDGRYVFVTQSEDGAVSKSPMGMFETLEIDNDLQLVDKTVREYYELDKPVKKEKEGK